MSDYDGNQLIQLPAFTLDEIHAVYEALYGVPWSRGTVAARERLQPIRDEFPPPPKVWRTY